MLYNLDGRGTKEEPYQINTLGELQAVNQELSAHYELDNDINAVITREWNDGKGFEPIGDRLDPFTGTFDGKNYQILNLCIKRPKQSWVGLFGCNKGQIKNLGIKSLGTITGKDEVGGLVGRNMAYIVSSYARGNVSGENRVGGLVGRNWGTVESSHSVGDVFGNAPDVGSLVGINSDKSQVSGSFVFCNLDKPDIPDVPDLIISRNRREISYVVDTNTLYLEADGKMYYSSEVSPIRMQELVDVSDEHVEKISEDFTASVVKTY